MSDITCRGSGDTLLSCRFSEGETTYWGVFLVVGLTVKSSIDIKREFLSAFVGYFPCDAAHALTLLDPKDCSVMADFCYKALFY